MEYDGQSKAVDTICQYADTRPTKETLAEHLDLLVEETRDGTTTQSLQQLIQLLTKPNKLTTAASTRIIKQCLLPRKNVPSVCVRRIVSSLGCTGIASQVKTHLLRWLVIVYAHLESKHELRILYGLLFSHLRYESSRHWTCQLLCLTTTRAEVKGWRVAYLLELYNANRDSQSVLGLLHIYKDFAPSLIVEQLPPVRLSIFANIPDPKAAERLQRIQGHASGNDLKFKRARKDLPETRTSGLGVEDIRSLDQFVKRVHKLKFPLQMGSVLKRPDYAIKLLLYRPEAESWERLNVWLENSLDDQLLLSNREFAIQSKVFPAPAALYVLKHLSSDKPAPEAISCLSFFDDSLESDLCEVLETQWTKYSIEAKADIILALTRTPWKSSLVTNFFNDHALEDLKTTSVIIEDAYTRYYATAAKEPPKDVLATLSKSWCPANIAAAVPSAATPENMHLQYQSIKLLRKLEGESIGLQARHPHVMVTEDTLKTLSERDGLTLSYDEYLNIFKKYVQEPSAANLL